MNHFPNRIIPTTETKPSKMNSPAESLAEATHVMDVRPIPCSIKHRLILKRWRELPVGDFFILLNDHDPVPLYYQFAAEFPNAFTWEHLERGPEDFRVKITKLKEIGTAAHPAPCHCEQ
jgi:uncharacterized protein (DUF2249 family)